MTNYFLNSWMPTLFNTAGLTPENATLASSLYLIGGTVGGVLMSLLLYPTQLRSKGVGWALAIGRCRMARPGAITVHSGSWLVESKQGRLVVIQYVQASKAGRMGLGGPVIRNQPGAPKARSLAGVSKFMK